MGDQFETRTSQQLRASLPLTGAAGPESLLLGSHVDHKVCHPVAIAKFILTLENQIDKMVIEGNASPSIKGEEWMLLLKSYKTTWSSV